MTSWYRRNSEPIARDLLAHFPGVVIEGARQVGKSALAKRIAEGATVLNLDEERIRAAAAADPEGLVALGGDGLLVIDEIQRLPELTLAVKASIDADRRPGRFLLTGSASLLRVRGLADSLAGRVARLELFGLSGGEIDGVREDFSSLVRGDLGVLRTIRVPMSREEYVGRVGSGSYPELQSLPARLRRRWVDDYLDALLLRDLPELRHVVDPSRARSLLRVLAANQAGELVKARVAEAAGIPAGTVSGYLDLLEDVGLIALLPPWTPNLTKREVGRPKAVVLDSAVAGRLARITTEQLASLEYSEAFGQLLEGFVAAELLRQRTWASEDFELFHFRDRGGTDVDLVMEFADGAVVAIEVKASTSFSAKQFTGLAKLRDVVGDRFVAGVVLNTGRDGYRYADRLYGLPVGALWAARH